MIERHKAAFLGGMVVALLAVTAVGCRRQSSAGGDDPMHPNKLKDDHPDLPTPEVIFPDQLKTDNVGANEFIRKALESCHTGDYDAFRQLFGVTAEPPEQEQFGHVWKGVQSIRVAGTYKDDRPDQPPEYYVHVVVQLRQPDRYDRKERQAVIWLFREGDEWRLAPAPSEIQGRILYADSQPGDGEAPRSSKRHALPRPAATEPAPDQAATSPAQ